ncbi:hypothetical protein [Streptomyces sp. NPDC059278]|uniref:hypothetical protein n=1 Tax=Streptomyces sp. NPDC059278 TaxID=3346801 RepID=UPI0036A41D26
MSKTTVRAVRDLLGRVMPRIRGWWARRKGRRPVVFTPPPVLLHDTCPDSPHASLGTSVVVNGSGSAIFDVTLHFHGATGEETEKVARRSLAPGQEWRFDWGEPARGHVPPKLYPASDGGYEALFGLSWSDEPDGPLRQG